MTEPQETILVIDDDPYIQEALKDRLESLGYQVMQATDGKQALEMIGQQTPQMAFLDIEMPGMKGHGSLEEIRRQEKDFPVVMITAYGTIDIAVEAMKHGAADFVAKPFKGSHIAMVVQRTMEQQRLRRGIEVLTQEVDKRYQLVPGKSEKINQVIIAAKKAAATRSTVLLLGESGVGKELFARAIHSWSERHDQPFVAINCIGLSKDLLESELFGYERGAFTGAQQRKKGKIELAHCGTVFLDEIGDISEEIQTKLLRFLARAGVRAGWRHRVDQRQRAHHRRDQSQPAGGGQGWQIPRGPILPDQRRADCLAAAARAQGRYPRVGRVFSQALFPGVEKRFPADRRRRPRQAVRLRLAGQRPRARQCHRARGGPRRTAGDPSRRSTGGTPSCIQTECLHETSVIKRPSTNTAAK